MKGILLLVILIGAVLGLFGIVITAPPENNEAVAFMAVVVLVGLFVALKGPLGRALATLLGVGEGAESRDQQARIVAQLDELIEDFRSMRGDLVELQERVDFAERLLAQRQEATLPPGREGE